jgi:hypothetical protein
VNLFALAFVNLKDQPRIETLRLAPEFSWSDISEDWRTELESDDILPDAKLLAFGITLLFVFRGRID